MYLVCRVFEGGWRCTAEAVCRMWLVRPGDVNHDMLLTSLRCWHRRLCGLALQM